jgi:NADH-quinone oxidoreductase subunit J
VRCRPAGLSRDLDSDATGGVEAGDALFRTWVLPFEALSLLLLAALVGAITLSRRTRRREATDMGWPSAVRRYGAFSIRVWRARAA